VAGIAHRVSSLPFLRWRSRSKGISVGPFLFTFIPLLFNILIFAILIRALISWFPIGQDSPIIRVLDDITEPILAPLRRVVPRLGMMDITPIVAMVALQLLEQVIMSSLSRF